MTLLLCLNELSHQPTTPTVADIGTAMRRLVDVLLAVRKHREDTALVAEATFGRLVIGDGAAFAQWQADRRNHDISRFLKSQMTRSPFSSVVAHDLAASTEYTYKGVFAEGLGVAHLVDGLAVSLVLTEGWDLVYVEVNCLTLDEDESEPAETAEQVRHASSTAHIDEHRDWLAQAGRAGPDRLGNAARRAVWRGQAPDEIGRIDGPEENVPGSQWHAQGSAKGSPGLNMDGTFHDGDPRWPVGVYDWLSRYGWRIPLRVDASR